MDYIGCISFVEIIKDSVLHKLFSDQIQDCIFYGKLYLHEGSLLFLLYPGIYLTSMTLNVAHSTCQGAWRVAGGKVMHMPQSNTTSLSTKEC